MLRQGFDAWAERAYAGLQISLRNPMEAQPGMAVPLLRPSRILVDIRYITKQTAAKIGGSESHVELAFRAGYDGAQINSPGFGNGQIEVELSCFLGQFIWVWRGGLEEDEVAALRRVDGGVK